MGHERRLALLVDADRAALPLGRGRQRPSPRARPRLERPAVDRPLGEAGGGRRRLAPARALVARRQRRLEPGPAVPPADRDVHALGREDALLRQDETLMGDVQQVGRLVRAAVPGRLDGVPRRERIARQEGEVLVTARAGGRRVGHRVRRLRLLVVRRREGDAHPPLRLGRAAPEPGGGGPRPAQPDEHELGRDVGRVVALRTGDETARGRRVGESDLRGVSGRRRQLHPEQEPRAEDAGADEVASHPSRESELGTRDRRITRFESRVPSRVPARGRNFTSSLTAPGTSVGRSRRES